MPSSCGVKLVFCEPLTVPCTKVLRCARRNSEADELLFQPPHCQMQLKYILVQLVDCVYAPHQKKFRGHYFSQLFVPSLFLSHLGLAQVVFSTIQLNVPHAARAMVL